MEKAVKSFIEARKGAVKDPVVLSSSVDGKAQELTSLLHFK
jgi:hypothetical protein